MVSQSAGDGSLQEIIPGISWKKVFELGWIGLALGQGTTGTPKPDPAGTAECWEGWTLGKE